MAAYLENLGLDFLMEEKVFGGIMGIVAQEGKGITGYYGLPYLNRHFADVQMILRTAHKENETALEGVGLDTHAAGNAVWEVRLKDINIDRDAKDLLSKRVVVTKADGSGGMAVVELVNADVLPSFLGDDLIKLQMIGFSEEIDYFKDEEEYSESLPKTENNKKFGIDNGVVFPVGLLSNRNPNSPEFGKDENLDNIIITRGIVKDIYWGEFELGDTKDRTFIKSVIDTEFGPLEIVHTIEAVKEEQRENLKKGAIVSFTGVLSGDAAIYEYEKGIVRDEEHNLAALRYVLSDNDPERLRSILSENIKYYAGYNRTEYTGKDATIERLKLVQNTKEEKTFCHFATITSIDDKELDYTVGKRCLILATGEEEKYDTIVFIETNEEGNIKKIVTTAEPRYHFSIDQKPEYKNPFEDVMIPKSVVEQIVTRARFHEIIADDKEANIALNNKANNYVFENNIKQILDIFDENKIKQDNFCENLFGYLFAKAIEYEYFEKAEQGRTGGFRHICSYSPDDIEKGEIHSGFEDEKHKKIEKAMNLGRQFKKDFDFYMELNPEESVDENLYYALIAVQKLGAFYSEKLFSEK